jgi:hypothetical protein
MHPRLSTKWTCCGNNNRTPLRNISNFCRYRKFNFTVMHYADDAIHFDWQFISDFASRRKHNETLCVFYCPVTLDCVIVLHSKQRFKLITFGNMTLMKFSWNELPVEESLNRFHVLAQTQSAKNFAFDVNKIVDLCYQWTCGINNTKNWEENHFE